MQTAKVNKREAKANEKALPKAVATQPKLKPKAKEAPKLSKPQPAKEIEQKPRKVAKGSPAKVELPVSKTQPTTANKINLVPKVKTVVEPERPKSVPEESTALQPSKPLTAFFLFANEKRADIRTEHQGAPMTEVSKLIGAEWQKLDEKAKQPYLDQNAAEKKRHERQLLELSKKGYFILPNGKKSSDIRKPLKDDPRPKRVISAYTLYLAEKLSVCMKEHGLTTSDAMKKCGAVWTSMAEAEKEPFLLKVRADKERYDLQKDEFDTKGYFTLPDGKKSFEVKNSPAKRPKRSKSEPEEAKELTTKKASKNATAKIAPASKKMANPRSKGDEQKDKNVPIANEAKKQSPKKTKTQ